MFEPGQIVVMVGNLLANLPLTGEFEIAGQAPVVVSKVFFGRVS